MQSKHASPGALQLAFAMAKGQMMSVLTNMIVGSTVQSCSGYYFRLDAGNQNGKEATALRLKATARSEIL